MGPRIYCFKQLYNKDYPTTRVARTSFNYMLLIAFILGSGLMDSYWVLVCTADSTGYKL